MPSPISTLPSAKTDRSVHNVDPEVEGDEILDESDEKALTEVDEIEASTDEDANRESSQEPRLADERKGSWGLVALILAALLVGSIAINLKQSRDVAALQAESTELEQALTTAIERIDNETSRANGAEAALERVDSAVDLVNERVLGLQTALDGLREATVR